jgi:hypothetical protein
MMGALVAKRRAPPGETSVRVILRHLRPYRSPIEARPFHALLSETKSDAAARRQGVRLLSASIS